MKEIGKFLLKIFGIVAIVLFALWIGSLILGKFFVPPECPECTCDTEEVVSTTPDVEDIPTGDVTFSEEETTCRFADGYDSFGKVVPPETKVFGPALIKPDRNRDHAILLMPSASYETVASDEVIWLLVGDSACVNSQAEFFSSSETINH